MTRSSRTIEAAVLALCVVGCAPGDHARDTAAADRSRVPAATAGEQAPSSSVPLAARPRDACGWIPADDVRAIVGAFAEPPRRSEGGCLYTLALPPSVVAERAEMARIRTAIKAPPIQYPPYAVRLDVEVGSTAGGERAMALAAGTMASWLASDAADSTRDTSAGTAPPASRDSGWDVVRGIGGRLGTLEVSVSRESPDVDLPRDSLRALAERVRDRIPDLPFPMPTDYSAAKSRDPCAVLTRDEAESVLGRLVVAPYRTANGGPLAYANGTSCAYFTARHHVLVLTPRWSGGRSALRATRGVGAVIANVVHDGESQSADTIEGTWDETAITPDGRLELRTGDRSLEIAYTSSSTNEAGALRLARLAMARLTASP